VSNGIQLPDFPPCSQEKPASVNRRALVHRRSRLGWAVSYLLCVRVGRLFPGKVIVPERIRDNRVPYYAALRKADEAWEGGNYDINDLGIYLAGLLQDQLRDAAAGK